jgi:hypothetical protein
MEVDPLKFLSEGDGTRTDAKNTGYFEWAN